MTSMASMPMQELLDTLDAQCEDYQVMYREGLVQRDCLRDDDLKGLNVTSRRIRMLMDRVRGRQVDMPADLAQLGRQLPEVGQRLECLRQTIQSVLDVRDETDGAARQLLDDTRRQLYQVGTGRRASRGYRRQPPPQAARFVDVR